MQTSLLPTPEGSQPCFVLPIRVYYEDTDAAGVVYYANYLRFCERARTEWLRALGFDQRGLLAEGNAAFVVRSVHADYLAPARLDDRLVVANTLHDLHGASVFFTQRVLREHDQTLLFVADIKIVCVNLDQGRSMRWPESIYAKISAQLQASPTP
ncbi:MAG: tol-pal system-associated acyl-CoA thioesterase [Azoarcus sp.]|jgi:acyl-CoA thioester hydrolase|nr:tol-pal system-associated acyl-CoA thioesterase [Azoarcus sp.]